MRYLAFVAVVLLSGLLAGCGTTRMSDTSRTGTEQLLLSSAVDRAINNINFKPLAGKDVYLDTQYLEGIVDKNYVVSSLRQHMLAHGCHLKADRKDATYVAEARAGAIGTNRHDVMLGVPAINVPTAGLLPGAPSAIPEIPFAKTTNQKGIAKIAVFAYNQETDQPVWQSGVFPVVSDAKDTWLLGAGPFQRGSIYEGTRFAGNRMIFSKPKRSEPAPAPSVPVTAEAVFEERPVVARAPNGDLSQTPNPITGVEQAQAIEPQPAAELETDHHAGGPGSGGPADMVPHGRIVRLPPTEHVPADSDAIAPHDPLSAPEGVSEADPRATDGPGETPGSSAFSLFKPRTWFRTQPPEPDVEISDYGL